MTAQAPQPRMRSNVTGDWASYKQDVDPKHYHRNITQVVDQPRIEKIVPPTTFKVSHDIMPKHITYEFENNVALPTPEKKDRSFQPRASREFIKKDEQKVDDLMKSHSKKDALQKKDVTCEELAHVFQHVQDDVEQLDLVKNANVVDLDHKYQVLSKSFRTQNGKERFHKYVDKVAEKGDKVV